MNCLSSQNLISTNIFLFWMFIESKFDINEHLLLVLDDISKPLFPEEGKPGQMDESARLEHEENVDWQLARFHRRNLRYIINVIDN